MGNQWDLGLHFSFVTILMLGTISICLDANITVGCIEDEHLALLSFKHSVRDDSGMLSSWAGTDCCRWEGVHCDSVTRNVESLNLKGNLFGDGNLLVSNEVSASLGELRHLKYLDLSGNDFQGSPIPQFIGSLKQLRYLDLSRTKLSGIIPNNVGNLSNMKHLNLGFNSFKGQLPRSFLINMSSLQFLDLSEFVLSPPWNLANFLEMIPSVLELHLSKCNIDATVPSHTRLNFTARSNIQHLDLSHNFFVEFPSILTNITSLQVLDLSYCFIQSPVPIMPNLLELDLSFNNFKQFEDVGLWRQCYLRELRVSGILHMELIDLPTNITKCSQYAYERLYLSFKGPIPESLGRMAKLRELDLSGSMVTGPLFFEAKI